MADHPTPDISGPAAAVAALQDEVPAAGVDLANEKAQQNMSKEKKKAKKEKVHVVSFYKLFSFADRWDYMLMIVGSLGAIGNGVSLPLMTIIFGDLTNAFGNNQGDQSAVVRAVSKVHTFSFLCSRSFLNAIDTSFIFLVMSHFDPEEGKFIIDYLEVY